MVDGFPCGRSTLLAAVVVQLLAGAVWAADAGDRHVAVAELPATLAEYPVDDATRVELALSACEKGGECRLSLRLWGADRLIAEQQLAWGLSTYGWASVNAPEQATLHVSRSQSKRDGGSRFSISFGNREGMVHDHDQIEVEVDPLKLRGFPASLLVTQVAGFESVGESYSVYAITPQKILVPFSRTFALALQQMSATEIRDLDQDGFHDVVIKESWHFFVGPGDVAAGEAPLADRISFHVFPKKARRGLKAYAVVLARSSSYLELLEKRAELEKQKCLTATLLFLLGTTDGPSLYPRLTKDIYFIGDIFLTKREAQEKLRRLTSCAPGLDGYVKRAL